MYSLGFYHITMYYRTLPLLQIIWTKWGKVYTR